MADFTLFNQKIEIEESYFNDFQLNSIRAKFLDEMHTEFSNWYKKSGSIEKVLDNYIDIALELMNKYSIDFLYSSLTDFDIYD